MRVVEETVNIRKTVLLQEQRKHVSVPKVTHRDVQRTTVQDTSARASYPLSSKRRGEGGEGGKEYSSSSRGEPARRICEPWSRFENCVPSPLPMKLLTHFTAERVVYFNVNGTPITEQQINNYLYTGPTCAEVKKMWIYTSTPPYAFMNSA
jgi:hypothetical protein